MVNFPSMELNMNQGQLHRPPAHAYGGARARWEEESLYSSIDWYASKHDCRAFEVPVGRLDWANAGKGFFSPPPGSEWKSTALQHVTLKATVTKRFRWEQHVTTTGGKSFASISPSKAFGGRAASW